jgi:hypothetical protein
VTILVHRDNWREDTVGHTERTVNFAVDLLWSCITSDGEGLAIGGRQLHGHHLGDWIQYEDQPFVHASAGRISSDTEFRSVPILPDERDCHHTARGAFLIL